MPAYWPTRANVLAQPCQHTDLGASAHCSSLCQRADAGYAIRQSALWATRTHHDGGMPACTWRRHVLSCQRHIACGGRDEIPAGEQAYRPAFSCTTITYSRLTAILRSKIRQNRVGLFRPCFPRPGGRSRRAEAGKCRGIRARKTSRNKSPVQA